jgi:hypothetical protein
MLGAYEAEHVVVHLDDDERFTPTTTDVEWLTRKVARFQRAGGRFFASA